MNKTYSFLGYVANGNGIKFGDSVDSNRTIRLDHSLAAAPGSTKREPINVLRNAISSFERVTLPGCDECSAVTVPVAVTLSFSGPSANQEAVDAAVAGVVLTWLQMRARQYKGFLPSTGDFTVALGTAGVNLQLLKDAT